jgi:two-component system, cell cycle sensor histidine kinase and response regulator CckA
MRNEVEHLRKKIAALENRCSQLEKHSQQNEERFLKIFHTSSNLMAITTIKDGKIVDLNEASASLGGYKREELIGTSSADHNLWAEKKCRDFVLRKLQSEGSVRNLEVDFLGKSAELHKVLFSADPITVNDEPCLLSVSVDITARESELDALRKSEEKYRMLVENSLQGAVIIQDGRFVFCNSAFAMISGYSIQELLSLHDSRELVHPEDRKSVTERYNARIGGKSSPRHYEYRIIRKDGAERWLEVYASLAEYNGKPAVQSVHMDITERKQAEDALRESEERFRLIAETIDEIFWIYDAKSKAAVYLSPAYDRIWGHSRDRVLNNPEPFMDQVHPDDRERIIAGGMQLQAGQPTNYEYRIMRADGSVRHMWDRGFPIKDENGVVQRYVGSGRDITEWRQAEDALKESREYLNQIINHISDPIFVKDSEHNFVLVNDAMCAFLGRQREELIGVLSNVRNVAQSLWEQEETVIRTGREIITEDNIPDGQGNIHTLMTKKSLLMDKSGNKQIVGVLRDMTEYKRLEAQFIQAQKMEAIGLLAGGVAHDFNNLLNVIKGYSELILDDLDPNNPIREDLEQIRDAGQRAAVLTSQLLAFGRKQILQPEILDLNTVIVQMSSMLRRLIGEDIELNSVMQPDLELINADPGKIEQIIMNLVVNARDAMPQGGKLTIETANVSFEDDYVSERPVAKKGPYVMMAISDNGMGMDAATQAHLFEPFFTTKEKGKGTGLGLSTIYGIVKQSEGYIWVYSEPGKGTTFKVYFPRSKGEISKSETEVKLDSGFQGSETVLVVEDESSVRSLISRILRDRGYNVMEAENGEEALRINRAFAGEIHLVLTDAIMPGLNGKELVSQIELARPDVKSLYVSGYADNAIVHHGILDSNISFLQKPFSADGLAQKVRKVLDS